MNGIPKRVSMRSISEFGLSQITLVFEDDADDRVCAQHGQSASGHGDAARGRHAGLSPDATPDRRSLSLHDARGAAGFPPEEVRALEDWVVEKKMRSVPGVVDVNPFGGLTKQYQVLIDPAKLKSYGLNLAAGSSPRWPTATPTPAVPTWSTGRNFMWCAGWAWSIAYRTLRRLPWQRSAARPSTSAMSAK